MKNNNGGQINSVAASVLIGDVPISTPQQTELAIIVLIQYIYFK